MEKWVAILFLVLSGIILIQAIEVLDQLGDLLVQLGGVIP